MPGVVEAEDLAVGGDRPVAAAIAVAAFGAASAAPLGLNGVIAIGWRMAVANPPFRRAPVITV